MGRAGRKIKAFFGRIGKGIKKLFHKGKNVVVKANDAYEKGKQYYKDHQGQIDAAKEIARKHGGKYGGKIADGISKGESAYHKGTNYIDKQRDKARQIVTDVKQAATSAR